ncbi:FAD-containing oxidoreductase [Acidisphaera rubrifaciens]|uniref:Pyridine nucleotide-disulphide oxidoreductase dimerisation region n=1 Tax=Acidisphaera rubrifaciens HS-AP3 TaxID=1231350 RepID=A0A0D6P6D3_9PROT|nr:FAD-containing oxidoreductase [Acidisphaera rubrifaciens]GAN77217.1 pyridine nucleotide-disulphide oxidoreductase dimerisation region [Acidisphaera rubrifaciens HS-AP3]
MTDFDAIIIGAGQAGPSLAFRLAGAGMKVAVIERHLIGGSCVNTGCTPTKALVASAYVARIARRAGEYGLLVGGDIGIDMRQVKARMDAIVAASRNGLTSALESAPNIMLYRGHARFASPQVVTVAGEQLRAGQIFINVGGRAVVPPMPGINEVPYLTNSSMMNVDFLPPHLIIIGGSYIGLEFGQMYRRFGSQVTIIEMGPRLVRHEDEDVSAAIKSILELEGIEVRLNAECVSLAKRGDEIIAKVDCTAGAPEIVGSHLLLAVGRRPNTDDLDLDIAGVRCDERGYIVVDDRLQTTAPGIWALGDCNGRGAFTHTAYNDFEIVAAQLLDRDPRSLGERITAYALYTDPPLARVGMTLAQARPSGRRVLAGDRPMTRVARAVERGETQGFMRILVDGDSKEILGASLLGTGCDEAVHAILDLMYARVPYTVMQRAMHIHPTVSELLPTILGGLRPVV